VPPAAWSDPATEEFLGLAVDLLEAGDGRGLLLLRQVLGRECGPDFAATVVGAIEGGAPPAAFDFLPQARRAPAPPAADAPAAGGEAAPAALASEVAEPGTAGAGEDPPQAAEAAPPRPAPTAIPERPRPPTLPAAGYVTANEVAAHFGVSVKAVYRWMKSGRIASEQRPGGSYRIPAEQFAAGGPGRGGPGAPDPLRGG